jgi:DNA-binding NtrC family response regulator
VAENRDKIRILAIVSTDTQSQIRHQLSSLDMSPVFISRAEELGHFVRNGEIYQVALLPAFLPEGMDWWTIWGEVALLTRRPAILVYAHTANFQLWSGVLEAGGYDIVAEPFTHDNLREAVLRAAKSFEQQHEPDRNGDGLCPK